MNMFLGRSGALGAITVFVPTLFFLSALIRSRAAPFRAATFATSVAVVVAAFMAVGSTYAALSSQSLGTGTDVVAVVMLLLVSTIGVVIVRYSKTYLEGDPGAVRYARWLMITLGAVMMLVLSNNLLIIAFGWTATSLALHQLLTFYPRQAALVAAHKKFLVSRLADLAMWTGVVLVYRAIGSLNLDTIDAWARSQASLPLSLQVAAVLFAIAACLKSAQLPFHGWLTQVMEAPTPVSALLHAGVVNIGGFLMIRLAPLMARAPAAQVLLLVVGMTTTVLAALIMTTRVSIKVSLAWSTCAQMGFMLVQCSLGAWHLAMLHLVAHSIYKAHAFLSSGSAVHTFRVQSLSQHSPPVAGRLVAASAAAIATAVGGVIALTAIPGWAHERSSSLAVPTLLVAFSVVPLMRARRSTVLSTARSALRVLGATIFYFGFHAMAARALPDLRGTPPFALGWFVALSGFVVLFVVQSILEVSPGGRLARTLHPYLFAGLYLDETFTRLTFRLWPPRLNTRTREFGRTFLATVEEGA